jgi:hypothetical protein
VLVIEVPISESFNDETSEFVVDTYELELEHSLASVSKWESKFKKPFLTDKDKTAEEVFGYIQAMTVTPKVPLEVFYKLSSENVKAINAYINDKHTATWFSDDRQSAPNREIITAEVIRGWMIAMNIPLDYENRNLSQLFTLIKVCRAQQEPPKKMSRAEIAQRNRELNQKRKAQLGTRG